MNRLEELTRLKDELQKEYVLIRDMESTNVAGRQIKIHRQKAKDLRRRIKELERIH